MDGIKNDPRFAHVLKDPRFRRIPKTERKVKIDKRFKGIFEDEDFKTVYKMDKRGRPINKTSKEDLKKFYDLSSSDESEKSEKIDSNEEISSNLDQNDVKSILKSSESDQSASEIDSDDEIDLARGVGNVESSDSDTSSDESDEENDEVEFEHKWGELDTDAVETSDITRRIALCNMDWDRIKASDIFVLCNSFKPTEGIIESVKIYPSEYGKMRLKEEELSGPKELIDEKIDSDEEKESENIEGSKYHMEKLRKYQLNRLRYFYAIVECDTSSTANKIYDECSGIEYESSAVRIDLRFVPDSMTFDDEPTSVATSMPQPEHYKPSLFMTTALQQVKVELTWDETDPDRVMATRNAFDKKTVDKVDLKAYLASSDDETDVSNDEHDESKDCGKVSKYRQLLLAIEDEEEKKKEKEIEMEITWTPGLKEATQDLIKKKQSNETELTPWDQYLKKKKEKRLKKKELKNPQTNSSHDEYSDDELPDDIDLNDRFFTQELGPEFMKRKKSTKIDKTTPTQQPESDTAALDLLMIENDDRPKHFNTKRKSKNEEIDNFQVDVNDERFSEIYTSHLFNVDPSNPQFKMTKGMERMIEEKQKRRKDNRSEPNTKMAKMDGDDDRAKKRNAELKSLVKSIKNRTKSIVRRKK